MSYPHVLARNTHAESEFELESLGGVWVGRGGLAHDFFLPIILIRKPIYLSAAGALF